MRQHTEEEAEGEVVGQGRRGEKEEAGEGREEATASPQMREEDTAVESHSSAESAADSLDGRETYEAREARRAAFDMRCIRGARPPLWYVTAAAAVSQAATRRRRTPRRPPRTREAARRRVASAVRTVPFAQRRGRWYSTACHARR